MMDLIGSGKIVGLMDSYLLLNLVKNKDKIGKN